MEQRLSLITLGVTDLARNTRFYEALGWRRSARDAEGVSFFQVGGLALGLYPLSDLARDAAIPAERVGLGGVCLAYNTRTRGEVDAVLAEAEVAGGRVVKPAEETFWGGYAGYFADPEGHLWEVAWNPGFTLDDDGALHLPE